jgi:hypothetical protein
MRHNCEELHFQLKQGPLSQLISVGLVIKAIQPEEYGRKKTEEEVNLRIRGGCHRRYELIDFPYCPQNRFA